MIIQIPPFVLNGSWERPGLVTVLLVALFLCLTGRLVPYKYYRQICDQLKAAQAESLSDRETAKMAIAAMDKLADRLEDLYKERLEEKSNAKRGP